MNVDIVDKYCTDDNNPIKKTYAWISPIWFYLNSRDNGKYNGSIEHHRRNKKTVEVLNWPKTIHFYPNTWVLSRDAVPLMS